MQLRDAGLAALSVVPRFNRRGIPQKRPLTTTRRDLPTRAGVLKTPREGFS